MDFSISAPELKGKDYLLGVVELLSDDKRHICTYAFNIKTQELFFDNIGYSSVLPDLFKQNHISIENEIKSKCLSFLKGVI